MKVVVRIFFLFSFTFVSLQSFSQGKIDRSKQDINTGRARENHQSSQASQPGRSNPNSYSECEQQSLGDVIFGGIAKGFLYLTYYSTIGNYKTENHLHSRLTKYPYYNNRSGNYEKADSGNHLRNLFRADIDYQFIYSNRNLTGNYFKCNIRPFQYFYLQGQYHALTERINSTYSNLSLYNFNFCYDRLRFEKFNAGWKLGMCYISNNVNSGGFSFGLDAEAFIVRPFSLYISKQWDTIHNVAVNEFELTGRYHINKYNIHLGYEHFKIGSPLYDHICIGGGVSL